MTARLEYIGAQEFPGHEPVRLWNLFNSPRPDLHPDGSTVSLQTLEKLGIVSKPRVSDHWTRWRWLAMYQTEGDEWPTKEVVR